MLKAFFLTQQLTKFGFWPNLTKIFAPTAPCFNYICHCFEFDQQIKIQKSMQKLSFAACKMLKFPPLAWLPASEFKTPSEVQC